MQRSPKPQHEYGMFTPTNDDRGKTSSNDDVTAYTAAIGAYTIVIAENTAAVKANTAAIKVEAEDRRLKPQSQPKYSTDDYVEEIVPFFFSLVFLLLAAGSFWIIKEVTEGDMENLWILWTVGLVAWVWAKEYFGIVLYGISTHESRTQRNTRAVATLAAPILALELEAFLYGVLASGQATSAPASQAWSSLLD